MLELRAAFGKCLQGLPASGSLLNELQPGLEKALEIAHERQAKLTVANLPLCRIGRHIGFADELYWLQAPLWREVEKFVAIHDEKRTEERFRVTQGHHKVKSEACRSCRLESLCDGLNAEYERWMGFDVLRPQPGTPITREEAVFPFLLSEDEP